MSRDDPQGEAYVEQAIQVLNTNPRVLGIDVRNILTLAAPSLLARMEDKPELLAKSGLVQFEQFIARSMLSESSYLSASAY